jgi:Transglutaminase-like superfamily
MSRLRKFVALPGVRRRQVLEALAELVRVRVGLTLSRRSPLDRLAPPETRQRLSSESAQDLAWAVEAASRYVPRATCLVQALALQALCARRGYETSLQIGVAHGERKELEAHAWLVSEGRILIGSRGSTGFAPLSGLPSDG